MKYSIDKNGITPAYLQIYTQIRRDIAQGILPLEAKLPSKRVLAGELGVSVITVEHAYELLTDEGYILPKERSGYYICYGMQGSGAVPPKRAAVEDMSAALSEAAEDFPFSVLARTMRRVLSEYDRRILIKSPNSGCIELRNAIAAYLARSRGLELSPKQIIVGSGAEYLYGLVVQLLGTDRQFALEAPSYEKIRQVYEANGADCVMLRLGEDGIESAALEKCRAGVLHVTPFHSYPSGVTASAAKRHEYARWAQVRGSYIVEDDYDSEFSVSTRQIETIFSAAPERVIYLNTFSKTLAPAVRTGYMVLPEPLLEEYEKRLGFYSCTVPVFEQYVLAEFIDSGDLERYINRRRRKQRQQNK